jgi:hypothetical protein
MRGMGPVHSRFGRMPLGQPLGAGLEIDSLKHKNLAKPKKKSEQIVFNE